MLGLTWQDASGRRHSEEQRQPGDLRQGDHYRGQAWSSARENDLTTRDTLASDPGKRSTSPRRGRTATGPLSIQRDRRRKPCRSRPRGDAHRADEAQKHGAHTTVAALCATLTVASLEFPQNPGAGLAGAPSRTIARLSAPSEEGLPRQAIAPGTRTLPVTLRVASEEAARREVVTPQALAGARPSTVSPEGEG